MQLRELKERINNKESVPFPLIFIASNNDFLVHQYLYSIAKNLSLNTVSISSLKELDDITSSVFYEDDNLFIFKPDKDALINKDDLKNNRVIILSENPIKGSDIDAVKFDKLENWMVEDYAKTLLPGLTVQETNWLCKICNYNIDRVDIECQKLSLFDKKEQESIFELINKENGYCDLNDLNIFNLTNAIIKKDILTIKTIIKDIDNIDIEGTGLVTILLKQFLNIINIQLNSHANAATLGMSEKQFRAISYNCNKYSSNKLISIYKFLNDVDYRLKSGLLDISNKDLVQVILSNILN